jgi:pyruvate formate lyase activating enzyme
MGGTLIANGYGRISAIQLDPVIKKPLRRFYPNHTILSIGGFGCNLHCPFCQNHTISLDYDSQKHTPPHQKIYTPDEIAALALRHVPRGNIGAAYTYNEPLINYEFVYDCAKALRHAGLKNVLVTNGYIMPEPFEALLPFIDAVNIDLKAFNNKFYQKAGGTLQPVTNNIALAHQYTHVEVTTLIIPGENNGDIENIAQWLSQISTEIPLHLSCFFPRHKYTHREPTPPEMVYRLCEVAEMYLKYVYAGNIAN